MVWFGVTATIGLAIVYLFAILAKRLRENHSDAYREIGEPSVIPKQLATANWGFFRFLWFGEFRQLGDPQVNRLCVVLILLQLGFVIWVFWPLIL
jgi:hypothetical protein